MIQLGWALVDESFTAIDRYCVLVKPRVVATTTTSTEPADNPLVQVTSHEPPAIEYEFTHDGEAARINGISHDELVREGRDINEVLDQLLFVLQQGATHFVAHNAGFDLHVIQSECHRVNRQDVLEALNKLTVVCTKNETRMTVNLPGPYGPKPPKLSELYAYCYGPGAQSPTVAHRADGDVETLRLCLVKLREMQLAEQCPEA
jgi:DNA polymerase III epsilon subunit-like protein